METFLVDKTAERPRLSLIDMAGAAEPLSSLGEKQTVVLMDTPLACKRNVAIYIHVLEYEYCM